MNTQKVELLFADKYKSATACYSFFTAIVAKKASYCFNTTLVQYDLWHSWKFYIALSFIAF